MVKAGGLAAAAAAIAPQNAEALVDYAGLPYLGGAGRVCLFVVCVRVCVCVRCTAGVVRGSPRL